MPGVRAHVIVSGRVQGVWYRGTTRDVATKLGLRGWVRNLPDGNVEAVFEGEKEIVDKMVRWCHEGPTHARVDRADVEWEEPTNEFSEFSIRY